MLVAISASEAAARGRGARSAGAEAGSDTGDSVASGPTSVTGAHVDDRLRRIHRQAQGAGQRARERGERAPQRAGVVRRAGGGVEHGSLFEL